MATVPEPFHCEVVPEREGVRVIPKGELDLATVGALDDVIDELRGAGFRHIVLDLRELTFIDSTGLRTILRLNQSAEAGELILELTPGNPQVQRIFAMTRTLDELPFIQPKRPT